MSDVPQFVQPHHLTTRETMLRPDSPNSRGSSGGMTVAYSGLDDGMIVEFYEDPEYMEYLSKTVGHPVFRNRIMTRMVQPGNTKTVWVHPTEGIGYEMVIDPESGEYHTAWEQLEVCENGSIPEPVKYPGAWNRFLKKASSADAGLPVEEWGIVSRSYAMSLKSMNVHTVEALAALTDQAAQSIMGAIKYRDLAKAHLDERTKIKIVAREQERASRFEEQCQTQAKQIEALQQHVLALQSQLHERQPGEAGRGAIEGARIGEDLNRYNKQESTRQMSVKDAKRRHKIPVPDAAA